MSCCTLKCFAKMFLIFLNTLFVIVGLIIVVMGIIMLAGENMMGGYLAPLFSAIPSSSGTSVLSIFTSIVIIAVSGGLFILIVAILGCCAGTGKSRCVVIVYSVIMVIILLIEITALVLSVTMNTWVNQQITNALKYTITNGYEGSDGTNAESTAWNYAFVTFDCCGVENYTDLHSASNWNRTSEQIPVTCCNVSGSYPDYQSPVDPTCVTNPTETNSYFNKGCFSAIREEIEKYSGIIIGSVSGVMALELLAVISAIIICRGLHKVKPKKQ